MLIGEGLGDVLTDVGFPSAAGAGGLRLSLPSGERDVSFEGTRIMDRTASGRVGAALLAV